MNPDATGVETPNKKRKANPRGLGDILADDNPSDNPNRRLGALRLNHP